VAVRTSPISTHPRGRGRNAGRNRSRAPLIRRAFLIAGARDPGSLHTGCRRQLVCGTGAAKRGASPGPGRRRARTGRQADGGQASGDGWAVGIGRARTTGLESVLLGRSLAGSSFQLKLDFAALSRVNAKLQESQQRTRGPVLRQRRGGEDREAVVACALHRVPSER
jgi:hypothetical protein